MKELEVIPPPSAKAKVAQIRSNLSDKDKNVYIQLSWDENDPSKTIWSKVIPDNEGARWMIQLALTAKIHNLDCYAYGKRYKYSEDEFRLELYEFGLE